jgi:molecular chaperone Hsp33
MPDDHDSLLRFIFEHSAVRGARVQLHQTLLDLFAHQSTGETGRQLLGESLCASVLLASTIKLEGCLSLQARGDGALNLLVAECSHEGHLRGVVQLDEHAVPSTLRLSALLGKGHLAVTLLPTEGDSYQGLVPLAGERLQDCIAAYFSQSEQLPTRLWLASDGQNAGGLLLQALPDDSEDNTDWEHLCMLADTLQEAELLSLPHDTLLHRLFHQDPYTAFTTSPLCFQCTCSEDRSLQALATLGRDDLHKLLMEESGMIEVDCQFCGQQYHFDEAALQLLLGEHSTQIH